MSQNSLPLTIKNEQNRALTVLITDRPTKIVTTNPASPANQLPAMGSLSFVLFEGEEIVLTYDGIIIRKEV